MMAWRTRVESLDRIPAAGPAVIASNHGSYLDHFFLAYRMPRPVNFMAAAELFRSPLAGRILSSLGAFPVKRGSHDHDAIQTAETIIARGGVVVMYPQGGIRPSLAGPPKVGVGLLALKTGAPVVPAAIIDATTLHRAGFLRLRRMAVRFGDSIRHSAEPAADFAAAEAASFRVWDAIVELNVSDRG